MPGIRLEWDGKASGVPRLRLPLQVIETVNAARDPGGGWRNKLIWGDNLRVLASLADELAGQVDLVYIDPPFDSRQDYKVRFSVGDDDTTKLSPVLNATAYRDTWGKGVQDYLQMLYERLVLLRELLSDRGSLFLDLGPNVSHLARGLLDEIIWKRATAHADANHLDAVHEDILWFSKTEKLIWHQQYTPYEDWHVERYYRYRDSDGRRFMSGDLSAAGLAGGGYDYEWKLPVSDRFEDKGQLMTSRERLTLEGVLAPSMSICGLFAVPVACAWGHATGTPGPFGRFCGRVRIWLSSPCGPDIPARPSRTSTSGPTSPPRSSTTAVGRPQPHTDTIPPRRPTPRLPARPLIMRSYGDRQPTGNPSQRWPAHTLTPPNCTQPRSNVSDPDRRGWRGHKRV